MQSQTFFGRNTIATYMALTFLISWGFIFVILGPGNISADSKGYESLLPLIYAGMLMGPTFAAILSSLLLYGNAGPNKLPASFGHQLIKARWYAAVLLAVPVLATLILVILSAFSREFMPAIYSSGIGPGSILFGMIMAFIVGTFEEIGWTGFAVPNLRQRFSILQTGLITGIVWGAWHFLVFLESDSFSGGLAFSILLARLFAWLPPFRVIMVWLYDRTGSLLLTIILHASLVFTTLIIVPMDLQGKNLLTWILAWGWCCGSYPDCSHLLSGNVDQDF